MKLLETKEYKLEKLDLTRLHPHPWKKYEIPEGSIGVTTVLRYIASTLGTLKLHEEDERDMPWRVMMGMGWEAMAVQLYPEIVWQPKAVHYKRGGSNISGHLDGYSFQPEYRDEFMLEEFKYTARSLREKGAPRDKLKDIRAEWLWMEQVKGYAGVLLETHPYFKTHEAKTVLARFHIMWSMGAYEKYTLDERYLRYVVEFEREEVQKTLEMLKANEKGARI